MAFSIIIGISAIAINCLMIGFFDTGFSPGLDEEYLTKIHIKPWTFFNIIMNMGVVMAHWIKTYLDWL